MGDPISMADWTGNNLKLGLLNVSLSSVNLLGKPSVFWGKNVKERIWNDIRSEVLYHILDLRQANYEDDAIIEALNIVDVTPNIFIHNKLGRCTRCFALGHEVSKCSM